MSQRRLTSPHATPQVLNSRPLHPQQGALSDCWPEQPGFLPAGLPFTPSVTSVISRHASNFPISPSDEPADAWPCQESPSYTGGDEREAEGSDRKQRKKKKRRQKEEGPYDNAAAGDNSPTSEEFYSRIGPRKDAGGGGGWEEQLGKSGNGGGGRGKKGKSRKKIPEEWGLAEPFVPASEAAAQIQAEVVVDLGLSSGQAGRKAYFPDGDASPSPWKAETFPEDGLVPAPLSQDLFSFTASPINPLAFSSELNATAPPFTMPTSASNSSPPEPSADDSFILLMESADSVLPTGDDGAVDSGVFVQSSLLQDAETSVFSPASQSSLSQPPAVASAPPLSPSDASWLLSDSHVNSGGDSDLFDFSEAGGLGVSMAFDTPSPAPLRSPKTTAQEFQPREGKSAQKAPSSASPSSHVKMATFPGEADTLPAESLSLGSSSPSSLSPGSALNPSAKPFFPSFASSLDEDTAAAVPPASPVAEGWFCCCKSRT